MPAMIGRADACWQPARFRVLIIPVMAPLLRALYGGYALTTFLLAAVIATALLAVVPGQMRRRRLGRHIMRLTLLLIGVPVRVQGGLRLPETPAVCVSNHASQLDGLVLFATLPARYTFVVRAESRRTPLFGFMLERVGVIWMDRADARSGSRAIRVLIRQLRAGRSVAMFPEGTIRPEPGLQPFKIGAFLLAAKAAVPLVPVWIRGTRVLFPDQARLPARTALDLHVLEPIMPSGSSRENARALLTQARVNLLALGHEQDRAAA